MKVKVVVFILPYQKYSLVKRLCQICATYGLQAVSGPKTALLYIFAQIENMEVTYFTAVNGFH
jgi:hypothetical protein